MSLERKNRSGSPAADNAVSSAPAKEAGVRNIQDTLHYLSAAFDVLTTYKDFKGEEITTKSMSAFLAENEKGYVSEKNLKDFLVRLSGIVKEILKKIPETQSKVTRRSELKLEIQSLFATTPPSKVFYDYLLKLAENSDETNFSNNVSELVNYMGSGLGVKKEEFHENVNKKMNYLHKKYFHNDKYQAMFDDAAFFKSGLNYLNEAFKKLCEQKKQFEITPEHEKSLSEFFAEKLKEAKSGTLKPDDFLTDLSSKLYSVLQEIKTPNLIKVEERGKETILSINGELLKGNAINDPLTLFLGNLLWRCESNKKVAASNVKEAAKPVADSKSTVAGSGSLVSGTINAATVSTQPPASTKPLEESEIITEAAVPEVGALFSLAVKHATDCASRALYDLQVGANRSGEVKEEQQKTNKLYIETSNLLHHKFMDNLASIEERYGWQHIMTPAI